MEHPPSIPPRTRAPVFSVLSLLTLAATPILAQVCGQLLGEYDGHNYVVRVYTIVIFALLNLLSLIFAIVSCVRYERFRPLSWIALVLNLLPGVTVFGMFLTAQ